MRQLLEQWEILIVNHGGFNPSIIEGGSGEGIGLIQWSFGRKTKLISYANSKGLTWQDEDTQIEFLIAEISGQGPAAGIADMRNSGYIGNEGITSTNKQWKDSKTVEEATLHFMRFFESPTKKEASFGGYGGYTDRTKKALEYYNKYKGKEIPDNVSGEIYPTNNDFMGAVVTTNKRVSAKYGNDGWHTHYHHGVDIAAPGGTKIISMADGTVEVAANGYNGGRGIYVRVNHGNGYQTLYQHCSKIASGITAGTKVKKGQTIAYVGSTGDSSGNHLHLEVWVKKDKKNTVSNVYDNWGNATYYVTDPSRFNFSLLSQ